MAFDATNPLAMPYLWERHRELCATRVPLIAASFAGEPFDESLLRSVEDELDEVDMQIFRASGQARYHEEVDRIIERTQRLIDETHRLTRGL